MHILFLPKVMWESRDLAGEDEIEAGIFCLLFCAVFLATSPIWIAILFFSRKYKDPNWDAGVIPVRAVTESELRS